MWIHNFFRKTPPSIPKIAKPGEPCFKGPMEFLIGKHINQPRELAGIVKSVTIKDLKNLIRKKDVIDLPSKIHLFENVEK